MQRSEVDSATTLEANAKRYWQTPKQHIFLYINYLFKLAVVFI